MASCDKTTLQPGGPDDPCKDTIVPPGGTPPGGVPDRDDPFNPPPPVVGNCNIDDDCPRGYICVNGVCVPDPKLPGGPNTPIIPPADPNDPNVGDGGGGDTPGVTPGSGLPGTPGTPGDPTIPDGGNPSVPGGENGPPFPGGPSNGAGGGCCGEFICLVEPPVPTLMINPLEEVEGGDTLRDQGEGPVYKVAIEVCEDEELLEELPLNPVTCSIDQDCPEGFICQDGLCVAKECAPACCDILEEGVGADEFCELREKEYDENDWEVTDREREPFEQGYPYPFSGTLGKGKEYFDHSLNCQAQNGQELWNVNDGLSHTDCHLPDKYAKVKWEPRGFVYCRRVDFCDNVEVWKDLYVGDLNDPGGCNTPKGEQISGRLFVQNATTLYDSLTVGCWTHLDDDLKVEGFSDLQDTKVNDLTITGTICFENFDPNEPIDINEILGCGEGPTDGIRRFRGPMQVVGGGMGCEGNLVVGGEIGRSSASGGNLIVNGRGSISGSFGVEESSTVGLDLTVGGTALVSQNLTVGRNADVSNTMTSNKVVCQELNINGKSFTLRTITFVTDVSINQNAGELDPDRITVTKETIEVLASS